MIPTHKEGDKTYVQFKGDTEMERARTIGDPWQGYDKRVATTEQVNEYLKEECEKLRSQVALLNAQLATTQNELQNMIDFMTLREANELYPQWYRERGSGRV